MTVRLLEAVPNFSEGRDRGMVLAIVDAMRAAGADVLDWSADPDHHRSVVTVVGAPEIVEESVLAGARIAIEHIDLACHDGRHPRVGAVDVLPFVPLIGLSPSDATATARNVGARLARDVGVPVYFYGWASDPPGRTLVELRKGGFEALMDGWPAGRLPDLLPEPWPYPGAHPRAGVTCVGARDVLLAWNVVVVGLPAERIREIARELRPANGGFPGVRAMGIELPQRGVLQISMNIENLEATSPLAVFRRIEDRVGEEGGRVVETEVVGMLPDQAVLSAAEERLALVPGTGARLLSRRVLEHLAGSRRRDAQRDSLQEE